MTRSSSADQTALVRKSRGPSTWKIEPADALALLERRAEQRRLSRVECVPVAQNLMDERGQFLHGRARDNRLRHQLPRAPCEFWMVPT